MSDAELTERLGVPIITPLARPHSTDGRFGFTWLMGTPAWRHTSHSFGFIPADASANEKIRSVGEIAADPMLRHATLRISLDGLRIADYPGGGTHRVLFNFFVQNRTDTGVEDVNFNATYRVREGSSAAVLNYPIFFGVNPTDAGLVIRCFTVNVKNDVDESFLNLLESETFKVGLRLATIAQPAIAPLSSLAIGMTKAIAERHRNVPVQDVYLGLDFGGAKSGARLALGTYIAVQMPEAFQRSWRWSDWTYDTHTGQIVNADGQLMPLNYFMIGISQTS
ncbi:hypothetical protein [Micromonospora sp. LOL_024]|uniref:hypothetical protein n=1 Tax=Micromonospora sp. LOL_024 TaxID=3345412 RepID=UPI003A8BD865